MSPISIFCFVVALAIVASCFRKGADPFSPGRVFGFLWAIAIGLTDLKFSSLQMTWTPEGWLLLLIGIFSFLVGVFVLFVIHVRHPLMSLREMRATAVAGLTNPRGLYRATIITFVFYAGSFLASYLIKGFVPMFTAEPTKMRTQFTVFGFGLLVHAAPAIMFFVVQYFVLVRAHRVQKAVLVVVFLLTAASYFTLLQRFDYAIWAVASLVFVYYSSRYLNWKTLILPMALFLGFFYGVQSVRLIGHIEHYMYIASKLKFGVEYAVFTEPYMYTVMNLENFVHAAQLLDSHTYGYYSFNFIMSLTGLKHWIETYASLNDSPFMILGYNTYSFLWTYYRDFGIIGLCVFPMLEGAGIATLYYRMRLQPTLTRTSLYGLAAFVMLISFFHNALAMLQFIIIVIVVFIVTRIAAHPARVPGRTET